MLIKQDDIHEHEEVEESLNIMDKEKELIIKALKKHKGKRKDASTDLGISERTLYRKLKEYDIDEWFEEQPVRFLKTSQVVPSFECLNLLVLIIKSYQNETYKKNPATCINSRIANGDHRMQGVPIQGR